MSTATATSTEGQVTTTSTPAPPSQQENTRMNTNTTTKKARKRAHSHMHYRVCKTFLTKHLHTNMPTNYELKGYKTGKWLSNQRFSNSKGKKLSGDKLEWAVKFKSLGFPITTDKDKIGETKEGTEAIEAETLPVVESSTKTPGGYMKSFVCLMKFKQEHENFNVPANHALSGFCTEVRLLKETGAIPLDLYNLLQAVEFPWVGGG